MKNYFDLLVAETCKILGITSAQLGISSDSNTRWEGLAETWLLDCKFPRNPFYIAIHHMMWGRYLDACNLKKYGYFYRLLEETMLNDDNALSAWRKNRIFEWGFCEAENSVSWNCRTDTFHYYLTCRMKSMLIYKDTLLPIPNPELIEPKDILEIKRQDDVVYHCRCFIKAMDLLIPGLKNWNETELNNEKKIAKELEAKYGFNPRMNKVKADQLMELLRKKVAGYEYYGDLVFIKSIPTSMISVIWPGGVAELEELLDNVVNNRSEYSVNELVLLEKKYTTQDLINSWFFNLMLGYKNKLSTKAKKTLYEVASGIIP